MSKITETVTDTKSKQGVVRGEAGVGRREINREVKRAELPAAK